MDESSPNQTIGLSNSTQATSGSTEISVVDRQLLPSEFCVSISRKARRRLMFMPPDTVSPTTSNASGVDVLHMENAITDESDSNHCGDQIYQNRNSSPNVATTVGAIAFRP